ncbi:MAG: response regulator, partial [candidate division Zixibacteria bacterium]|nr:response regulator [candidate division Zixibacteria bacterium]
MEPVRLKAPSIAQTDQVKDQRSVLTMAGVSSSKSKKKSKVLVIDDDPNVCWLLNQGLSDNFEFKSARDGIEGIQMVTTESPDLILLDIKMPGMSGLEVLEKLNKVESRPDVLMLSGHAETEMVVKSVRLGACEFIKKPFDVEEVGIHINSALERNI